jgi:hypothetical protein
VANPGLGRILSVLPAQVGCARTASGPEVGKPTYWGKQAGCFLIDGPFLGVKGDPENAWLLVMLRDAGAGLAKIGH